MPPLKPTAADLRNAAGKSIPDVIAPGLDVLFCGINPGLYSAATGCHFARPGNRFWTALHAAGFTPRRLQPWEREPMLASGCGVTNLVNRATVAADELSVRELRAGARRLARKVARWRPRFVAVVGIGAYRAAFGRPRATMGRQPEGLGGAIIWVLPNTSGLNANHRPADFARAFRALALAVQRRKKDAGRPGGQGDPRSGRRASGGSTVRGERTLPAPAGRSRARTSNQAREPPQA